MLLLGNYGRGRNRSEELLQRVRRPSDGLGKLTGRAVDVEEVHRTCIVRGSVLRK